jgi:peptidoglycan-associated lipoprotein
MTRMLSSANVIRISKLGLVNGCLIGILLGCNSKSQTTVMSGIEPSSQPEVAKIEPASPSTNESVQRPDEDEKIIGNLSVDIPVEEPARPSIRPSTSGEIFATPPTDAVEPARTPPESPLIDESETPPPSVIMSPDRQLPFQEPLEKFEIPPISIEPEMPTLPTTREATSLKESQPMKEIGSTNLPSQELKGPEPVEPATKQDESIQMAKIAPETSAVEEQSGEPSEQASQSEEPDQIAKVVPSPAEPDTVESRKESILNVLEDVYFDYDRFTIRKDAIPVLEENAQTLVAGLLDKNVVIEGHCDQRGTESYNMVLGKRRANALKEFLVNLGVPGENLQVVSYGKEKPFCTDQNEQCWQENRRGHFILK